MSKKVLVTGAAGQVGSHVAELLLERGDAVVGIDNFATGRREHLPSDERFRFVEGTIADRELVDSLVADVRPDVIVHTAASYNDPDDWYEDTQTNVVGGTNLIMAARANGKPRFIYYQTSLCYGAWPREQPITLNHPKVPAISSYAISKTAAEDYLEIAGLDYVSFRLANVIGPRNVSGPLPIFYRRLKEGKRCFATEARRDFCYVKDLARITLQAVDGTGRGAYHFSSGRDVAIRELYDAVVAAMGIEPYPAPELRELGPNDARTILLDPSRTFEDFGEPEFTPLEEIVRAAVEYYDMYGVTDPFTHLRLKPEER